MNRKTLNTSYGGMADRLKTLVLYKNGGRMLPFSQIVGLSLQQLSRLVRGEPFSLQTVSKILSSLPDVNARWFLFGTGEMLSDDYLSAFRRRMFDNFRSLLLWEKYIPFMNGEELNAFETSVLSGRLPEFPPSVLSRLEEAYQRQRKQVDEEIAKTMAALLPPKQSKRGRPRKASNDDVGN